MEKDYRIPIQINVYLYRKTASNIEFLLMRRLPKGGGFWQGVTGAPKQGESLQHAAEREIKEETGYTALAHDIKLSYSYPVADQYRQSYRPDVTKIDEYAFVADVTGLGEPVLSSEHDAYKWLEFNKIDMEDLKWPENQAALVKAYEFIS